MKIFGGLVLVSAALMLVGCSDDSSTAGQAGSDDSASVAPSARSSSPGEKTKVDAEPYFRALASEDSVQMTRGVRLAAPGSLAGAYMSHQANGAAAAADAGADQAGGDLTKSGDGFKICYPDDDGKPCYTYDDLRATSSGRLAGFSINHKPLHGRVVLGNGQSVEASTLTVTVLSAYQTAAGELAVAVKLRTKGTGVAFFDPVATYRAPNGQQRALSGQNGLSDFAADSQGTEVYYFKGPLAFGGTITLQSATHSGGDNYGDTVNVTAKVG